jgi:negative regulator of flagellin synthesis FlgM
MPTTGRSVGDAAPAEARTNAARETPRTGNNEYAKAARRSESGAAEVSISPRAKELAAASRAVRDTPDVREDKVEHFRRAIQSGEYKPDAGKIADGIAREAIRDELSATPEVALKD